MSKRKNLLPGEVEGRKTKGIWTPGASALMVIFSVLCLTVFSILALSTVLADARLADKYAESVKEWYAADNEAERLIASARAGDMENGIEKENA